jgi:hypothetical protein
MRRSEEIITRSRAGLANPLFVFIPSQQGKRGDARWAPPTSIREQREMINPKHLLMGFLLMGFS